jgi:hypothetical protein
VFLFTLKVHEKTNLSSGKFFISGWFRFLWWFFGFFEAIDRFTKVSNVFLVKTNKLKNRFLDQKI